MVAFWVAVSVETDWSAPIEHTNVEIEACADMIATSKLARGMLITMRLVGVSKGKMRCKTLA